MKVIQSIRKCQEVFNKHQNKALMPNSEKIMQVFGNFDKPAGNQFLNELQTVFERSGNETITSKSDRYKKILGHIKGLYQNLCEFNNIQIKQNKNQQKKQEVIKINKLGNQIRDMSDDEEKKDQTENEITQKDKKLQKDLSDSDQDNEEDEDQDI